MNLDATWTEVRRSLLLLANGASTSFEQKVMSGKNDSTGPTFRHHELAELEAGWAHARNDRARQRVIDDARETLFYHASPSMRKTLISSMPQQAQERFRKLAVGQTLLQLRDTEPWKIAVANEGRTEDGWELSVRAVALIYDEPRQNVQRWRERYCRPDPTQPPPEHVRTTMRLVRETLIELDALVAA